MGKNELLYGNQGTSSRKQSHPQVKVGALNICSYHGSVSCCVSPKHSQIVFTAIIPSLFHSRCWMCMRKWGPR